MKLSYEDKVQIYELRKQGQNFNQLSKRFGVEASGLRYMMKLIDPYGIEFVKKGITRSMSRKGTPADNACIEWFHSVLKSETFYLHKWRSLTKDSITDIVKNYILFYNETRIQQKLNDQSPVEYRKLVA